MDQFNGTERLLNGIVSKGEAAEKDLERRDRELAAYLSMPKRGTLRPSQQPPIAVKETQQSQMTLQQNPSLLKQTSVSPSNKQSSTQLLDGSNANQASSGALANMQTMNSPSMASLMTRMIQVSNEKALATLEAKAQAAKMRESQGLKPRDSESESHVSGKSTLAGSGMFNDPSTMKSLTFALSKRSFKDSTAQGILSGSGLLTTL